VRQGGRREQERIEVRGPSDGGSLLADHRRVAGGEVAVLVRLGQPLGSHGVAVEGQLAEDRQCGEGRGTGEQPSARKFSHV
jgi:hypothetical protein